MRFFPLLFVLFLAACAETGGGASSSAVARKSFRTEPQETLSKPQIVADGNSSLIGRSASDIRRSFREPDLKRAEPPAEVWQYSSSSCVLFLYFYPDGGEQKVKYVDIRNRGDRRLSVPECARQVRYP